MQPPHSVAHDRALGRALVWLRRDLRVEDHAALYHALTAARQVWCAFVFDRAILDALPRADRRVEFIRDSLVEVDGNMGMLLADLINGIDLGTTEQVQVLGADLYQELKDFLHSPAHNN